MRLGQWYVEGIILHTYEWEKLLNFLSEWFLSPLHKNRQYYNLLHKESKSSEEFFIYHVIQKDFLIIQWYSILDDDFFCNAGAIRLPIPDFTTYSEMEVYSNPFHNEMQLPVNTI